MCGKLFRLSLWMCILHLSLEQLLRWYPTCCYALVCSGSPVNKPCPFGSLLKKRLLSFPQSWKWWYSETTVGVCLCVPLEVWFGTRWSKKSHIYFPGLFRKIPQTSCVEVWGNREARFGGCFVSVLWVFSSCFSSVSGTLINWLKGIDFFSFITWSWKSKKLISNRW